MSKKTDIQMRVDAAMNSLTDVIPAAPQPFFFTRLQARLHRRQRNVWEDLSRLITRPAFAVLSLSLVVLLNTFVILSESSASGMPENSELAVADEYNRTSSYYDLENAIP
jgi:uncharacterized membrane protein YdfJ with MMPL/SSD domain